MIKDINKLIEHITSNIKEQMDTAVVGLSGGADSTLVAILCTLALGKENVYGIHMPYDKLDADTFNSDSEKLAKHLGIKEHKVWIDNIAGAIDGAISYATGPIFGINKQNTRSRARMCVLYGICHHYDHLNIERARVVGTGNLSENFIGYDTKGGDALADIFPIGELFKSEVYQLLDHFRDKGIINEEHINRVPSAGLVEGQTDEGDLGYTYNEMEPVIKEHLKDEIHVAYQECGNDVTDFVIGWHDANKHKHEAPNVIKVREFCDE